MVGRLGIKENEVNSDMNANSRLKLDIVVEKWKDHVSIQKEVSNLNSKKAGTFGNIHTKVFERIIQGQFSSFTDESLSPYSCGCRF